jgi:hypothetical protein
VRTVRYGDGVTGGLVNHELYHANYSKLSQ